MNSFQETINRYFKIRKEVVAVYLFGSHAAGKERPFSDVDIGVVLHHRDLDQAFMLQRQYTAALGRQLRKDVHAVILNTAGEMLLSQVFKKGVCVCINDDNELKRFKMIRYSMISEFGYYLKMTEAGFHRKTMEDHSRG
jgi:predicted nucleotidyltransferase